jgi:hypothetical protein
MKRLSILTALLVVAMAAAALASTTGTSAEQDSSTATATSPATDCQPETASDRAAAHPAAAFLSVLRRSRSTCDAVPAGADGQAARYAGHEPPADFASSRRVQVSASEANWVMPGAGEESNGVCILGGAMLNCPDAAIIAKLGVAPSISASGKDIRLQGVAADGVTSIDVTLEGGERQTISVRENTFALRTDAWPLELRWQHGGREQAFPFPSR